MDSYLLSIATLVPLAGAGAIFLLGRLAVLSESSARLAASVTSGIAALAAVRMWTTFVPRGDEWQFVATADVLPGAASYIVGVDGLGLLLVLMTSIVLLVAVVATPGGETRSVSFYGWLLVLESGMIGAYAALDLMLFAAAWTVAAAALTALLGPGADRNRTAARLVVVAIAPALLLVASALVLQAQGRSITGAESFDFRLFRSLTLAAPVQRWVFVLFASGIALTTAAAFRGWLKSPTDNRAAIVPAIVAAVFLKLATYALLRVCLPVLPDATREIAPYAMGGSAIGLVLSAVAAFAQVTWTRVLAYASLCHVALVLFGVFALTPDALTGSVIHQATHGLSIAALFLVAAFVTRRSPSPGEDSIASYGGLLNAMPLAAAVALAMTLALVGVPKSSGYIGTRLILEGAWPVTRLWSLTALVGLGLSGVALVWLFARTMLGELKSPAAGPLTDLRGRELLVLIPLVLLTVVVGVLPARLLSTVETSVARVVMRVSPEYASEVADCLSQPPPPPVDTGLPAGMVMAAPCADGSSTPTSAKPPR
jgi:NADH-quinone oxidoreductase subunit M